MLKNRVIPILLLKDGKLVKTVNFENPQYVGDPINVIHIFNKKEVDELIIIDISASKNKIEPNFNLIKDIASECFMPLTYGGGIKSINHVEKILSMGVEKVSIQSAAIENPEFITHLSKLFGSQSVIVSLDIKKNWLGEPKCYYASKNSILKKNLHIFIKELVDLGAGELLINNVDKDGTLSGPDLKLIKQITDLVKVPIISCGGISSLDDIKSIVDAGANAVGVGSFFIYYGPHRAVLITYPSYHQLETLFHNK